MISNFLVCKEQKEMPAIVPLVLKKNKSVKKEQEKWCAK